MHADIVVIGAGMVGVSTAYFLSEAGLHVCVVDRGGVAGGTTGSGEGNILVSDKVPGPELELARLGCALWQELAAEFGESFEYERKGGIIVADTEADAAFLRMSVDDFRQADVEVSLLDGDELRDAEPYLAPDMAAAAYFPQDAQVQPMLAAAVLLRAARRRGVVFQQGIEVLGIERDGAGAVTGVQTNAGPIHTRCVINAAGPWSAQIAAMAGVELPIQPRKGHIVVTEPLPVLVRHKVYEAGYASAVTTGDAGLQVASVVEGTKSGTILLGSSRQRVGFDRRVEVSVIHAIVQRAVRFFPVLAGVRAMRAYVGFRPYPVDHLPIIGADPEVPGLYHNTGHEGAGIGLGPISGKLLTQLILGRPPDLDPAPFSPARFAASQAVLS